MCSLEKMRFEALRLNSCHWDWEKNCYREKKFGKIRVGKRDFEKNVSWEMEFIVPPVPLSELFSSVTRCLHRPAQPHSRDFSEDLFVVFVQILS